MFPRDGALDVSLLLTSTSARKYGRLWRRYFLVRIFISISRRRPVANGDDISSATPPSYVALPSPEPESRNGPESNTVDDNSTRLLRAISRARRSFSNRSFSDRGASPAYVPVPQTPAGEQRGSVVELSTQPQHAIEVEAIEDEQRSLRNDIDRIVKEKDAYELKKFGGVSRVASVLGSSLEFGRIGTVSQASSISYPELYRTDCGKGFFHFFFKACNHYTNLLLLISAILSSIIEIKKKQPIYMWYDTIIIVLALFLFTLVPAIVNFRRKKEEQMKLRENESRLEVKVTRSGQIQPITVSRVMVGDIVHLKKGDRVPADGLFVDGSGLVLEELMNAKIDEKNPFLFSGSKVAQADDDGFCRMIVTSVGTKTTLAEVLSMVARNEKKILKSRIQKPNAWIEDLALIVSVLVLLIQLIRLFITKHNPDHGSFERPELKGNFAVMHLLKIFEGILLKPRGRISIVSFLTVVVIGFQHGVPLVIAVSLSYWKEKVELESGGAKLHNSIASCTPGLVTALCIDATGGLICGPMEIEVKKFWIGEEDMTADSGAETDHLVLEALSRGVSQSIRIPGVFGSPTNDHISTWMIDKWGSSIRSSDQNFSVLDHRIQSSEKRGSGVLIKANADEVLHLHWRGGALNILNMCSHYYDCRGVPHDLENKKRMFEQLITDMENAGLYPLALAHKQIDVQELNEEGLNLLALVGLKLSCDEETKQAVADLIDAKIGITVVSEDELSAAKAIAYELGIYTAGFDGLALEGKEIRDQSNIERLQKVEHLTVMGSSLPKDKLLVIESLQQNGHVVTFFGGISINDIAALRKADLGIVGNVWALDLSRENADIVVFGSYMGALIPILKFGRCAYCNIQKFFQLQLTSCISGLLIALVATIHFGDSPISPIELIWSNVLMYLSGGLMMTMDINYQGLMAFESKRRKASLLSKAENKDVAAQVFYQALVFLFLEFKGKDIPGLEEDVIKVMIFNSYIICQILNQLRIMNLQKKEILLEVLQNYWFVMALGTIMLMQVLAVQFAEQVFYGVRLNGTQWAVCFIVAALPLLFVLAIKLIKTCLSSWSVIVIMPQNSGSSASPSYWLLLFSLFLFFSVSYYFKPGIARTFR